MSHFNAPTRTTTIEEETADNSFELTYVYTVKVGNKGINADQRRAFAKLVRLRAREVAVFAELIAGASQVKESSLRCISSSNGVSAVDIFGEQIEDDT